MNKFTVMFQECKETLHFSFDEALRIVEDTYNRPYAKLMQLDTGKVKEIKLPAGKLVKLVETAE